MLTPTRWAQFTSWWHDAAKRLGVESQCEAFLSPESGGMEAMMKVAGAQGDLDYVLFVLLRYWVPPILPPAGKERMVKFASVVNFVRARPEAHPTKRRAKKEHEKPNDPDADLIVFRKMRPR